jgi:uncharacterized membrane protein SpoIIM required for sporulation
MKHNKFRLLFVIMLSLIVFIGTQPILPAFATSSGPLYPVTGVSVSSGAGTIAWTTPGNITADDNVDALVVLSSGAISEYLQGTNFGFTIPAGAVIKGIVVTIGRSSSGNGTAPIQDYSVMLVKNGTPIGTNNASLGVKWPANHSEAPYSYTPIDPLWGTTWTATDINANNFGVVLSVINPDTAERSAFVDYINITVSYKLPTSLTVSPITNYYGYYTNFSATMTPAVAGKTINFTLNGGVACSAPTDITGLATCQAPLLANIGTYPTGVGASFAGDADYDPSSNTANLIINKRPATVTPNAASKIYGAADPTLTGTLDNFIPSDGITASYSRVAGETVLGGPYTISAVLSPIGKLNNYNITYNTANFTITPKAASVTPNAASKTYGAANPTLTGTLTGFLTADNVTAVYSRVAGETVLGSPYTISAVLSPAGILSNYTITYNTANFTITPKAASVTPNAASKTYGATDPTLTGTLTGFLPADNVTAVYSRVAGETVLGGTYTISAVLSPTGVLSNYTITYNTANFTISPKAAIVTPNATSKTYGAANPTLTGTLTGFLTADNVTAVYSRVAGETVLGSPYTISAVLSPVGVLSNYTITYNTANFTITPKAASVTPNTASKTYGAANPTLTGTLTGFLTADNVTAVYSRVAGETVLGSPYTISAVLSPTGILSNYTITYNTANFTITPKAASVTPNSASKTYGEVDPPLTGTLTGFLPADNVTAVYNRAPGETVSGSPYTISAVLSPAGVLSNYSITYNTASFIITKGYIYLPLIRR